MLGRRLRRKPFPLFVICAIKSLPSTSWAGGGSAFGSVNPIAMITSRVLRFLGFRALAWRRPSGCPHMRMEPGTALKRGGNCWLTNELVQLGMRHLSGLARPISQGHDGTTFFRRFRVDALGWPMPCPPRHACGRFFPFQVGRGEREMMQKNWPMIKDLDIHVCR